MGRLRFVVEAPPGFRYVCISGLAAICGVATRNAAISVEQSHNEPPFGTTGGA